MAGTDLGKHDDACEWANTLYSRWCGCAGDYWHDVDSPVTMHISSVPIPGYVKPITQVRLTGVLPVAKLMHVYVPMLEPLSVEVCL